MTLIVPWTHELDAARGRSVTGRAAHAGFTLLPEPHADRAMARGL
jgi:hypothetical protein